MAHDVFISHSSKDKLIADGICANLEAAGVRCWIAPRDIVPGEDWPTAILTAISKSRIMVLVFSDNSNNSEDVGREIALAANNNLVIIPFKIEDVEPEPVKKYYLATTNWLEAMNPPTKDQIQSLVQTVSSLIPEREESGIVLQEEEKTAPGDEESIHTAPVAKKKGSIWRWVWIPILIAVAALGWYFYPGLNTAPAPPTETPTIIPTLTATVTLKPSPTVTSTRPALPTRTYLTLQRTLEGHTGEVRSVAFNDQKHGDRLYLISGSSDNSIIIWNLLNWTPLHTITEHGGAVNSVAFYLESSDVFASASNDGRILTWSPESGHVREVFPYGHSGAVNALAFSNDGKYLASGSNDTTIILWDFQLYTSGNNFSKIRTIYDHSSFVTCLAFSSNGKILASGGYQDNTIMLHDPATGTRVGTLYGNADDIVSMAFSPNGAFLASASNNGTIILWDTSTWKKLRSFSPGTVVTFSPGGAYLFSGTKDGRIIVWNANTGDQLQTVETGSGEIFSLDFLDRNTLASGSADGTIQIWDCKF